MELAALSDVFLRLLAPAQKAAWLVPQVAWDNIYQEKVTKRLRTFFGSSTKSDSRKGNEKVTIFKKGYFKVMFKLLLSESRFFVRQVLPEISTSSGTGDGSWASKSDGQARGWGQGRGGMEPKLAKQLANPMLVRRGELWPVQDGERGRGGAWHSRESTQTLQ